MPTLLESYQAKKAGFESGLEAAMPGPDQIWRQQELLYRLEVLEACQMFVKTAPSSTDVGALIPHYQMVDAYLLNLSMERKYGQNPADEIKKQRDTAYNNLLLVFQDYRKRFGSFNPGNDAGCYRKTIAAVIQTVLPVWIQYRQTYIEIKKEAA